MICILRFLFAVLFTPLEQNLISIGMGIVSSLLAAITWFSGAIKNDVNIVVNELKGLRRDIVEGFSNIDGRLEGIEQTLREILKTLRK